MTSDARACDPRTPFETSNSSAVGTTKPGHTLRILASPRIDRYTGNPYPDLLYRGMAQLGATVEPFSFRRAWFERYDVVHLHWPNSHLRSAGLVRSLVKHVRLALTLGWARLRGAKIAWTCHNLAAHDKDFRISLWLFRVWFTRMVTHCIALSPTGLVLAQARFPALRRKRCAIIPHGDYRSVYPIAADPEKARKALGIPLDARVLLFFGAIRPYKQVPLLIECFKSLEDPNLRLVVAGKPATDELRQQIQAQAESDSRIILRLMSIPDNEVSHLFAAADLAVLPFKDILNSGSVMLALSLNRPALAPRLGALPDLQRRVGSNWLWLYNGVFSAETIRRAVSMRHPTSIENTPNLSAYEWDSIATATYRFLLPANP